jgi:hypothetical protein
MVFANQDPIDETDEQQDSTIDHPPDKPQRELRFGPLGSLEVLAILVSVFFVGTVALYGDALFATPTMDSTNTGKILDADEILQSDFNRLDTSVPFQ